MNKRKIYAQLILALLILLSACAPSTDTNLQSTVAALSARVAQTATAGATSGKNSSSDQGTAVVKATEVNKSQMATQTVQSEQASAAQEGTRTADQPILAELPLYGVDTEKGRVAWIQPALHLEVEGYNSVKADNGVPGTVVKDFVLSANIQWNTRFGDSGCGFVFRSDGDQSKPSQYMVLMTRFASGHIGFMVLSKGEIANIDELFPKNQDSRFSAENDSTNQLTIVGKGNQFKIYTNRTLVGEFNPDKPMQLPQLPTQPAPPANLLDKNLKATYEAIKAQQPQEVAKIQADYNQRLKVFSEANKDFPQGFVSMVALTQSGKVSCTYQNAWLWLMEDK